VTGLVHSHKLQGAPFTVQNVDLLDTDAALLVMMESEPDAIIHCAAVADLNLAENAPALAHKLNGDIPGILAAAASRWGIPFVHISTDAVFDGRSMDYEESDSTNPLSVYARSKLAGENAVQLAYPDALIARVVFFGWSLSGKRSLSEFFFNNLQAGKPVRGFKDTQFCPLYVEDLSSILLHMLTLGLSGLYHVVSSENLSKYEFGVRIAERFGFDPNLIEPVGMDMVARDAPRSMNLILKSDKLQSALGYALPSVDAGINKLYQRWQEGFPKKLQSFIA